MNGRSCPECDTGYLVSDGDVWGTYLRCLMCGWNSDSRGAATPSANRRGENASTKKADRLPHIHSWTAVVFMPSRRHNKPSRCVWMDCRYNPGERCCVSPSGAPPYCEAHQRAYAEAFGTEPPRWKDMSLRVPYGFVTVEYLVEHQGSQYARGLAFAQQVHLPFEGQVHHKVRRAILDVFEAEVGLTLRWFSDAVLETRRAQRRVPAEAAVD